MNKFSEKLSNGLNIAPDYIAFTVHEIKDYVLVIREMGFHEKDFFEMPKGANGYKRQVRHSEYNISVLFDGNSNMGIHVNVSGSAVAPFLEAFRKTNIVKSAFDESIDAELFESEAFACLCRFVLSVGKFSRLDIAIDDIGLRFFSPRELFALYDEGRIVSRWRGVSRTTTYDSHKLAGDTVYFGKRESEMMLRVYDKKREINRNKTPDADDFVNNEWVRWELEIKDKRANEYAHRLADGDMLSALSVGVLSYYFRVINLDDCNKSRCSTNEKWLEFVREIAKTRLHTISVPTTIYSKALWVENQVAPTLALMLVLADGQVDLLNNIALRNFHRLTPNDIAILKNERPDLYAQYFDVEE